MWHFHFQDVADMLKTPLSAHLAQLEHCKNRTLPVNFFFFFCKSAHSAAPFPSLGREGGVRSYHPAVMTPCRNSQKKFLKPLLLKLRLWPASQRDCVHSQTAAGSCLQAEVGKHAPDFVQMSDKGNKQSKRERLELHFWDQFTEPCRNCSPSADHIRNYLDDKEWKKKKLFCSSSYSLGCNQGTSSALLLAFLHQRNPSKALSSHFQRWCWKASQIIYFPL